MKFLLIVHHDETAFKNMEQAEQQRLLDESIALTHQLNAAGQYVHASPLQPSGTAVLVRMRQGKPVVTDGPFIETREQIAGYFLVDAGNVTEAVGLAARVPGARIGTVEVRPLIEVTGLPD